MTDPQKLDLLTEKFSYQDYLKFANTILPRTKLDIPFNEAVTHLKRIFGRKESQFALRYKCLKLKMEAGEDFDAYTARVNLKCEKFDLASFTSDDLKVLMFVQGLHDSQHAQTLEKLLSKLDETEKKREAAADPTTVPKLTLQDVNNIATRLSSLKVEKSLIMDPATASEVLAIQRKPYSSRYTGTPFKGNTAASSVSEYAASSATNPSGWRQGSAPRPCNYCGDSHWQVDCPFKEKYCFQCKTKGHKAGFCGKAKDELQRILNRKNRTEAASGIRQSNQVLVNAINGNRRYVSPAINNQAVKLQLDCGSDWTIISKTNHKRIGAPKLLYVWEKAVSASGEPIKILGKFNCLAQINGRKHTGTCYVAERDDLNVFGNEWMEDLGLFDVPINSVCSQVKAGNDPQHDFPILFESSLGLCNKMKASLTLKPDTKPIFRKARPVAFAAQEPIEAELKRLQLMGVITPIDYSDYAAPIVVVRKADGRIRICADYSTGLNDALEPHQYPLPTTEDIHSKLAHFKIFSKIDLSDAFLQIELDENAKKLMVINTHCGLFMVNRLQPGVKTAPGMFQQLVDKIMSGAKGVFPYMDDFFVGGENGKQHDKNLFEALYRLQEAGFRLKRDKCSFSQDSLSFLGLHIDANGCKPDPEKIQTLQSIPAPTDIHQLQAFLGAVTWYSKFIPGMKELRGPLDELLSKDVKFDWTKSHQQAFENLKTALRSDLALTHYDPSKKIIVAADASGYGVGAVIMHLMADGTERPILHAAKSLSKAEKNYPQIEREALALTFAVKKFHKYIFGRHFELRTDHKPLLSIFGSKTGIPVYTANRLQRYALTLLAYSFSIKYINTESFAYADFISRLIDKHDRPEEETIIATIHDCDRERNCFAIETTEQLPVSFSMLQEETGEDETTSKVKQRCANGWPKTSKGLTPDVAAFFEHRNEIYSDEDCLFLGHRTIIPKKLRPQVLRELHDGHPGIERMKLLARTKVYWPMINNDIKKAVQLCNICASIAKTPRKTILHSWPIPTVPWSRIHIDFAGPVNNFYYLVIVDALSNWPEIFKMMSTTTAKTTDRLEEAFSRHGLPDVIVSDNGPQFKSADFATFCKIRGVEHITSAPYHPQSNGRAERFVDLLKTGLKKLEGEGNADHALRKFLFCYRYTPSHSLGDKSPFEIMTGRTMKSKLDLMRPVERNPQTRNLAMEDQFNRHHGAKWKEFEVGEKVWFKLHNSNNKWAWTPGTITEKLGSVNYDVQVGSRHIKAHANQLKKYCNTVDVTKGNELIDHFEITLPEFVEPDVIEIDDTSAEEESVSENQEVTSEEEEFEDAQEVIAVPDPLRRSTRATRGKLPQRYNDFQMN